MNHVLKLGAALTLCAGVQRSQMIAQPPLAVQAKTTRVVVDMQGRRVTIPSRIERMICNGNPAIASCFIVAPEKIVRVPGDHGPKGRQGQQGARNAPQNGNAEQNYEAEIALHPDVDFDACGNIGGEAVSSDGLPSAATTQEKLGTIPVLCLDSNLEKMDQLLRFMGDVLNVQPRTNAMIAYYRSLIGEVKAKTVHIPANRRTRVYYAEGTDGLQTNVAGSGHTQLVEVTGAVNVATNTLAGGKAATTEVTKESLLVWNPDAIITSNPALIRQMKSDETWSALKAVQNNRVYLIPSRPYNWFDRPPGVNRIVGLAWAAHAFYPATFPDDWYLSKVKEYYKLFYQTDLSDSELNSLTTP